MTPFWIAPLLAVVCTLLFVFAGDARPRAKLVAAAVLVLSLVLQRSGSPPAWAVGLVLQAGLAIFVLLWLRSP